MITPSKRDEFARLFAAELDDVVAYIQEELSPEDVFADWDLEKWAYKNGWRDYENNRS